MVLTEAMAAGVPVIALDAPGAREVVRNNSNGRLLRQENVEGYVSALEWLYGAPPEKRRAMVKSARKTAGMFSTERCVANALTVYERALASGRRAPDPEASTYPALLRSISKEWDLWSNRLSAGRFHVERAPKARAPRRRRRAAVLCVLLGHGAL